MTIPTLEELNSRIKNLEDQHVELLDNNVTQLQLVSQLKNDINSVLEVLETIRSGVKFAIILGSVVKWVGSIAVAVGSILYVYTTYKGVSIFNPPK